MRQLLLLMVCALSLMGCASTPSTPLLGEYTDEHALVRISYRASPSAVILGQSAETMPSQDKAYKTAMSMAEAHCGRMNKVWQYRGGDIIRDDEWNGSYVFMFDCLAPKRK